MKNRESKRVDKVKSDYIKKMHDELNELENLKCYLKKEYDYKFELHCSILHDLIELINK